MLRLLTFFALVASVISRAKVRTELSKDQLPRTCSVKCKDSEVKENPLYPYYQDKTDHQNTYSLLLILCVSYHGPCFVRESLNVLVTTSLLNSSQTWVYHRQCYPSVPVHVLCNTELCLTPTRPHFRSLLSRDNFSNSRTGTYFEPHGQYYTELSTRSP